jgi:small subunit ribosomal protein S1
MVPFVIAVDGPAGSGKSTVSKKIAQNLGVSYVDSGALYRAVTLFFIENSINLEEDTLNSLLCDIKLEQKYNHDSTTTTCLNGIDVSEKIRSEEIVARINEISSDKSVRDYITNLLRKWSQHNSLIMDGRDIGSVVFPNADLKIYLDASVDVRAKRRFDEYTRAGKNVDLKSIKNQIIHRDNQDKLRDYGALVKCEDAEVIDTSVLTINQVVDIIYKIAEMKIKDRNGNSGKMMENVDQKFEENVSMHELMDEAVDPSSGEVISGDVVSVDDEFVYVNIGGKTEGRVFLNEFDSKPNPGDTVSVFIKNKKTSEGMYQLSHRIAETIVRWKSFKEWYTEDNTIVEGVISSIKQNGAIADFGVYKGFVPKTLAADIRFKDAVTNGEKFKLKIVKIDEKKKSLILSRKDYLDDVKKKAFSEIISKYKVGDVVQGTVTRLVEFGVFVDLGGFEALLHKNDISWRKVYTRKDYVKKGDVKDFKILSINVEEEKISLGLKQMAEDPWSSAETRYQPGGVFEGVVSGISNFGVFVELEEGIEGLSSAEEIVWAKKAPNPKSLYKKGDSVKVKVLSINPDEKTLALSLKQAVNNPWDTISDSFPINSIVTGKIKNIIEFGMFVAIRDDMDAFIHVSDITWDDSVKKPLEAYKAGQEVEFKITSINKQEMKISGSIKLLTKSPWELIKERYPARTKIKGEVTSIKTFGLFVKIEENVEGLVHISEVSRKKVENLEELYKVGDVIECVVLDVDTSKKKISLSIKSLEVQVEKDEVSKILGAQSSSTASIGDLIKKKGENSEDG